MNKDIAAIACFAFPAYQIRMADQEQHRDTPLNGTPSDPPPDLPETADVLPATGQPVGEQGVDRDHRDHRAPAQRRA